MWSLVNGWMLGAGRMTGVTGLENNISITIDPKPLSILRGRPSQR